MGRLHYGDRPYTFEDRALIHLQVVVGAKLRRMESFFLTWTPTEQGGSGRLSIWLHPGIHLVFEFTDQDAMSAIRQSMLIRVTSMPTRGKSSAIEMTDGVARSSATRMAGHIASDDR